MKAITLRPPWGWAVLNGNTILGTRGHQQLQAGNAVPVNVAHWLGATVADGLDAA